VEPEIRDYISNPPDAEELKGILKKLKLPAEALVRKKEALYKEKYEGKKLSESAWIKILCQNPVLIERPIVISGRKAVLCRPPERWKEILKK
jgi:arsenate reductase (glutaredoxin)